MFLARAVVSRHGSVIVNALQRKVLYGWRRKVGYLKRDIVIEEVAYSPMITVSAQTALVHHLLDVLVFSICSCTELTRFHLHCHGDEGFIWFSASCRLAC